jgi:hypothetical protein
VRASCILVLQQHLLLPCEIMLLPGQVYVSLIL